MDIWAERNLFLNTFFEQGSVRKINSIAVDVLDAQYCSCSTSKAEHCEGMRK